MFQVFFSSFFAWNIDFFLLSMSNVFCSTVSKQNKRAKNLSGSVAFPASGTIRTRSRLERFGTDRIGYCQKKLLILLVRQ